MPSKDVKVTANTSQAESAVANLKAHIDALHSKDVTVRVNEIHNSSFGPGAKAMVYPRRRRPRRPPIPAAPPVHSPKELQHDHDCHST